MSRWRTGDEWRWYVSRHDPPRHCTISVIEVPEKRPEPKHAQRVPFGFGIREPRPDVDPLLWDGED